MLGNATICMGKKGPHALKDGQFFIHLFVEFFTMIYIHAVFS